MTKLAVWGLTLGAVLLAATPTCATIQAILENPPNVQTVGDITTVHAVGGITAISGWAFSTLRRPSSWIPC